MDKNLTLTRIMNFYDENGVTYDRDVLNNILTESILSKKTLHDYLCTMDGWDAKNDRLKVNLKYKRVHNLMSCKVNYKQIIDLFYNNLPENLREMYNPIFKNLYDIQYCIKDNKTGEEIAKIINSALNTNISKNKTLSKTVAFIVSELKKIIPLTDTVTRLVNINLAEFTDYIQEKTVDTTLYISLNLYDFLTMSDGNSWTSCHFVDGAYRAGCMSYALDECTVITYIESGTQKSFRQLAMVNLGNGLLISRVYGGYNDGTLNTVADILSNIFGMENAKLTSNYEHKKLFKTANNSLHYTDYEYCFNGVKFYMIEHDDICYTPKKLEIGHPSYCLLCGAEIDDSESFYCYNCSDEYKCEDCGRVVNEDEVIFIDGYAYCMDCIFYCDHCNEFHLNDELHEINGLCVCDNCFDNYYTTCECCNEIVHIDNVTGLVSGECVCDYCLGNECVYCEDVEEYAYSKDAIEVSTSTGIEYRYYPIDEEDCCDYDDDNDDDDDDETIDDIA